MDGDLYIGVMSGTSMDGIDASLCSVTEHNISTLRFHSSMFSESLKSKLQSLSLPGNNEIDRMGEASIQLGEAIAKTINQLISQTTIKSSDITAIGCHGQTIRHRPYADKPFSLQIGDPSTIAQLTGITTITDFRMADMAASGQGAPLVPAFHQARFSSEDSSRVILNIGGIANISLLPPNKNCNTQLSGYDTGPGNILMDQWINDCLGRPYDESGNWAKSGTIIDTLLKECLNEAYFQQAAPKSTGKEIFNLDWLKEKVDGHPYRQQDIQRTLLELTAKSISDGVISSTQKQACEVYICGGGIHNQLLIDRLSSLLNGYTIHSTQLLGVDPQLVEATAFAWLARQTINNLPGNAPLVTGATRAKVLGGIYPAS